MDGVLDCPADDCGRLNVEEADECCYCGHPLGGATLGELCRNEALLYTVCNMAFIDTIPKQGEDPNRLHLVAAKVLGIVDGKPPCDCDTSPLDRENDGRST